MLDSYQIIADATFKGSKTKYGTNRIGTSCFCNFQDTKIKSKIGIRHGIDKIEGIP